jgi:hypothetical protein
MPCIANADRLLDDNRSRWCNRSPDTPACRRLLANAGARKRSRRLGRTSASLCRC